MTRHFLYHDGCECEDCKQRLEYLRRTSEWNSLQMAQWSHAMLRLMTGKSRIEFTPDAREFTWTEPKATYSPD